MGLEIYLVVLVVVLAVFCALAVRRGSEPGVSRSMEALSRSLGQLQAELSQLARSQDQLRQDLARGREDSGREFTAAFQGLRGALSQAQTSLAEVKALEQGRARQLDSASDSLKRLEAIVAGSSSRGAAGENILARSLTQLPPDLLEVNVAFGNKVVEYALRLPGGRLLPIDSKWTSAASLERLEGVQDPQERRRLHEQVARDLRARIRDMEKYLDPDRTLSIGLLAVPDAVYGASAEAHAEGHRAGVVVVPYSLALPYVLALYRLTLRFGVTVDTSVLSECLRALQVHLRGIDEEVEGRLSRGLVFVENSRDAIRSCLKDARRTTQRLLEESEESSEDAEVEPLTVP